LPGDDLVIGRERPGMACELFNAEQLGPQRRPTRAGAHSRKVGHPVLKARWQCLHGVHTFKRISANIWPQKSNQRHFCHSARQLRAIWIIFDSGAALIMLNEIICPL
jgi:hypothetical protein